MSRSKIKLVLLLLSTLAMPLLGGSLRWGGLPPGYGTFPVQLVPCPDPAPCKPSFWPLFSMLCALAGLVMVAFLALPRLFGFKPVPPGPPDKPVPYPPWFWVGLASMAGGWIVQWGQIVPFAHYAFPFLWWGFITAVDGLVYRRSTGRSMMATKPWLVAALAVTSFVGWYVYEYLNYFVLENWYYPNDQLLSAFGYTVWYGLAYTTVWPAMFEWYCLLSTFPSLRTRWASGPSMTIGRPLLWLGLILGLASLVAMAVLPVPLFFVLWIGLLVVLSVALPLFGFWSPYRPITRGDWGLVARWALAGICNGFFWEFWNYGSFFFSGGTPTNPNFWRYSIPYVNLPIIDTRHLLFSEMPLLGYLGYLPFGLLCATWWLLWAHLFDMPVDPDPELLPRSPTADLD